MKLVITYDVDADGLKRNYRKYLANRKNMLDYYEEIGNLLKKEEYEKDNPWMNFEEFVKIFYFDDDGYYNIEELEDYNYIYNRKMELKNEEEET